MADELTTEIWQQIQKNVSRRRRVRRLPALMGVLTIALLIHMLADALDWSFFSYSWIHGPGLPWAVGLAFIGGVAAESYRKFLVRAVPLMTVARTYKARLRGYTPRDALFRRVSQRAKHLQAISTYPNTFTSLVVGAASIAIWEALAWLAGGSSLTVADETLRTAWEGQIAFASAALPLLVFVIQLTKDDVESAQRVSEVLIRKTLVVPTVVFVLVSTSWFLIREVLISPVPGLILVLLFAVTVSGTIYGYWRLLELMFFRHRLHESAKALLHERFRASLDQSLTLRLARNIMVRFAKDAGVSYSLVAPRLNDGRAHGVTAGTSGTITDVSLSKLAELARQVQAKPALGEGIAGEAHGTPRESEASPKDEERVEAASLHRVLGQAVTADAVLMSFQMGQIEEDLLEGLESRVRSIFTIERNDG